MTRFNQTKDFIGNMGRRQKRTESIGSRKLTKVQEEMLVKLTKNSSILSAETESFSTSRIFQKDLFSVHVYKTAADIMYVSAFSDKANEMFLIELPKPKSLEVMAIFQNDYNRLCDNLDI